MSITIDEIMNMSRDLLDLTLDGWDRTIFFDSSKLAEEVGEVAEALNKSSKTDEDLAEELSDVIAVCAVIALKRGIDLNEAIPKKQTQRLDKIINKYHEGMMPEGFTLRVKA